MADKFLILNIKLCHTCKEEKPLSFFGKDMYSSDGLRHECKPCHNKKNKEWVSKHREQAILATRKWHKENKERSKIVNKIWLENNKEKKNAQVKAWGLRNREKVLSYIKKSSTRLRGTPKGKVNDAFSSAMYRSLKGIKGGRKWEDLVGYTVEDLMSHIEKQFEPWMSWANYGKYTWHIDHIIPVYAFNYESTDDIDFKRCWALSNLRPLKSTENHRKKNKLLSTFQPSLCVAEISNG